MTYFKTKEQLSNHLNKKFGDVTEINETEKTLIVKAGNYKLEIKKTKVANFDRTMIPVYEF